MDSDQPNKSLGRVSARAVLSAMTDPLSPEYSAQDRVLPIPPQAGSSRTDTAESELFRSSPSGASAALLHRELPKISPNGKRRNELPALEVKPSPPRSMEPRGTSNSIFSKPDGRETRREKIKEYPETYVLSHVSAGSNEDTAEDKKERSVTVESPPTPVADLPKKEPPPVKVKQSALSVEHQLLGVSTSSISNSDHGNDYDTITINDAMTKAGLGNDVLYSS